MNENDFEKIIMRLKPDASDDPNGKSRPEFEADLRRRLLLELSSRREPHSFFAMTRTLKFVLGGLTVVAIAVAAAAPLFLHRPGPGGPGAVALLGSRASVTQVGDDAFGPLDGLNTIDTGSSAAASKSAASAPSVSPSPSPSSPVAAAPMMSALSAASASGEGVASPGVIAGPPIAIRPYTVEYVYKGDAIHQDQAKLDVLKVLPVALSADEESAALAGLGGDAIKIPSFSGATVTNVTLSESQSFGYTIDANLAAGTFSIYENYSEWPQNDSSLLTASEIPSTSTIIEIANTFLADHGISTGAYGAPLVTGLGDVVMPVEAPTAMPMIPYRPDSVTVLYPLAVNGMRVYSSSGDSVGMQVTVNLRYGKVSAVAGINVVQYQSSAYDAITDASKIVDLAEHPSVYPVIYNGVMDSATSARADSAAGAAKIGLGTPTLAYEALYQANGDNGSDEFFVPAYVFPETSGSGTGNGNVIVPLIASFAQNGKNGGGGVRPVPLEAPAAQ